jgi:hypothetical protein
VRNKFYLIFNLTLLLCSSASAQPDRPTPEDTRSIAVLSEALESGIDPAQFLHQDCQANFPLERPSEYQSAQCNPLIEETFEKTQDWSLYSLIHRERPYNECTSEINFENINMPEVQRNLSAVTNQGGMFSNMAFQCQESMGSNDEDYSEQTLMLEASHGLTQLRIESMAKRSLQGLNKIDSILGRGLIKDSIACDNEISEDVKTLCENYSNCGTPNENSETPTRRRPRVRFHAQMTLEALKAAKEFDRMIDDLKVQRRRIGSNGPRGTRVLSTQQRERADEIDFMIEDLTNNKADVLSTVPWIGGLKFKDNIQSIENELDKISELNDDEQSVRKEQLENSLISDIGNHLVEQLTADKEELLRRYDVSKKSAICLHTGEQCRKFEENMAMAPPVDLGLHFNPENPQELFTKRLMEAGQCLEQRRASVSTYNRVAIDVASIGAGFLMGGAGGLVRLASVAGRFYVRGQRLRALGAGAVLALEGAAVTNGVNDSINSCQNVRRNMSQFQEADSNYQCTNDSDQMTLMTNYKQCLTDVLLTSVGVIAGVAPDIANSIRASRSARLGDVAQESADEIMELARVAPGSDGSHLRQALVNMNISPDEIADFKTAFTNAQKVLPTQNDQETFLVFFNHLSRRNQQAMLNGMPDSIRAVSTAGDSSAGLRLRRLKLSWNRALRQAQNTEQRAYNASYARHIANDTPVAEATRLARQDARSVRAARQETKLG